MQCRSHCGACCIAPSIVQPFYGMPAGKPAGVRCVHLDGEMRCSLFGDSRRPALCDKFKAEEAVCGNSQREALDTLEKLELDSAP